MKTGLELVMEGEDAWADCRKYNGALSVEVLKRAFAEGGPSHSTTVSDAIAGVIFWAPN
jgi:hypothetical protein